jgi:hypothetical protein
VVASRLTEEFMQFVFGIGTIFALGLVVFVMGFFAGRRRPSGKFQRRLDAAEAEILRLLREKADSPAGGQLAGRRG